MSCFFFYLFPKELMFLVEDGNNFSVYVLTLLTFKSYDRRGVRAPRGGRGEEKEDEVVSQIFQ